MSLRRPIFLAFQSCLLLNLLLLPAALRAADVWDSPAFSTSPEALRQAASSIKAGKDMEVTVLLDEQRLSFDAQGKEVEIRHMIYRIENEEGVKGWAETSGEWEPWRQAKPEIKVRVIGADGSVHALDPKTLNDVPVHETDPDVYSDRRSYGGPLPAIAVGAIVEEEVTTRDTAPFFVGGSVERRALSMEVPVAKSRIVLAHAETLPLHYVLHLLPDATVKKSTENGQETITIENGFLPPHTEKLKHLPADVIPYPEVEFGTGTSWQRVSSEYARLMNDKMRLADVQPLLAKVNVKDGSRLEIIRRIVAALHKNVRYTGVEFDEASLVPQFPSETLKRKYGDCKDKATLLAAMLRAAGMPATLALLDTGPGRDINVDLPGMGMFDHAIVYMPASGADGELWIDATDAYARPGDLPLMDYGRWALVVDEKTTALAKIPELTAEQNLHRETREFTMAESGPAKIVEINEQFGPQESDYREYCTSDPKKLRENNEKYVKSAYLAESVISLEKTEPSDLEKPFRVTYTVKGRRGYTDRENAVVYISQTELFDDLPDYFTTPEEQKKSDTSEQEAYTPKTPRTLDWQIVPFVTEWHYKITAPPGFKLRALPADAEQQLGTARYTRHYTANPEGTLVEAVLRFESGKARLTVEEARVLRDAVVKERDADFIKVTFDQVGYALLSAGKVKDALVAYHQLAALHPKEALHRIQLAFAYLGAGLGDKARAAAREAIALEPNSANAYGTLGWVLQHDLIGRRFGKGFDQQAALEAYRKALQLDPKETDPENKGTRADYAILLEYDSDGVRYSSGAHLDQAIAEFKEIKKQDGEAGKKYDDFVLYDLWYAGRFKELLEQASALPSSDTRKALIIGAVAAEQGPQAAVAKSLQITSEEKVRSRALVTAGFLLLRTRKYQEAAELYSAGAPGQDDSSRQLALAEMLRKTKPFPQLKMEDSDPRNVVQRNMVLSMMAPLDPRENLKLASAKALELHDSKDIVDLISSTYYIGRHQLAATQLPVEVALDIGLSNAKYNVEGDDSLGYHITLQTPNVSAQQVYVVRENGIYKLQNFMGPNDMASEALAHLERNDLVGARKWLDWQRENVVLGGGDDPLDGPIFPRFWTKGQEADALTARLAALSALAGTKYIAAFLPELVRARDDAKDSTERVRLNLALAAGYQSLDRWSELLAVAQELMKTYPDSERAFALATAACARLGSLDEWEKLLQARLQKHPDEPVYLRSQARLALYRGDIKQTRSIFKTLMDKGKATTSDLNGFAWFSLIAPAQVDGEAVDAAERANSLTQNANFSFMHTLACLYAARGKTKEARELLLKAMDVAGLPEPDSSVWLALGEIAEQYGESDAARTMYARVEKREIEGPGSNYALAQQRLAALKTGAGVNAKSGGQ